MCGDKPPVLRLGHVEAVTRRAAMGTGSDRGPTPDRRPGHWELGVAWKTAKGVVLAESKRVLIDDDKRFDGVSVIDLTQYTNAPAGSGCWTWSQGLPNRRSRPPQLKRFPMR